LALSFFASRRNQLATIPYRRTPFLVVHRVEQARKDVYGGIDDTIVLHAQLLRGEADSEVALVAMHPIGSPAYLPVFSQLARNGHHVVACATRYATGDAALQMEDVLIDLAACVRHTREHLGYKKIVLVGWSGGGSVMAGYQAEAEHRTIELTAAGEETPLARMKLLPGDALLLLASHRSRHYLLTGQLDPSIVDERDPNRRDAKFDLYSPANTEQPPYTAAFIETYRAAQIARNRKITAWAREKLAALKAVGRDNAEYCFTVHGTMADPRWLDPSLEPNDRRPKWTYLGDPAIVNDSPVALGRYTSLRSWLSQWSYDYAQVDSVVAGPRISVPSFVLTAGGDDACPVSHTDAIFEAIAASDKQKHTIAGANHYFTGERGRAHLDEAMNLIGTWLSVRGFH
jgi:alpha-beta hydrolase superfamily lysophospholipase